MKINQPTQSLNSIKLVNRFTCSYVSVPSAKTGAYTINSDLLRNLVNSLIINDNFTLFKINLLSK